MKSVLVGLLAFGSLVGTGTCFGQIILYDDLAPNGWSSFYPTAVGSNGDEFGDEITLATNTPRTADTFNIQYYSSGFTGGEQVEVRFYLNDGGKNFQNADTPGTKFYDSGAISLPQVSGANVLTLNNLNLSVPNSFTWTVQFTGVSGGASAGLAIQHPPSIGSSFNDFWEKTNGVWTVFKAQNPNPPPAGLDTSFGAQMTAVPEPAAAATVVAAALGAVAVIRTRWNRRP